MGSYSLGSYNLGLRILELGSRSWQQLMGSNSLGSYSLGLGILEPGSRSWIIQSGILLSEIPQSGILQSGILQSRATDFGAGQPLMGSCRLGSYSLRLCILELGSHSRDPTVWDPRVSG